MTIATAFGKSLRVDPSTEPALKNDIVGSCAGNTRFAESRVIFKMTHHRGNLKPTVKADARAFGLRELAQCNLVNDSGKLAPRTSYLDFTEGAVIQLAGQFARVSDD